MGYSDHMQLDGMAPTEVARSDSTTGGFSLFGWLALAVVVVLWVLFGIAMWASPGTLADIWAWVNDLPMAAKIIVWVLGLPWMVGLAIWQGGWPDMVRIVLVVGLAWASVWTFWPKKSG